jgi:peptide/nickel transport system permease protein
MAKAITAEQNAEQYFVASSWTLMRRKFMRHRFAVGSAVVLTFLYGAAAFAGFVAPYDRLDSRTEFAMAPPTRVRVFHDGGLQRPFVYGLTRERDPVTLLMVYKHDTLQRHPIRLLVTGDEYKLIGLFRTNKHLFGVEEPGVMYLFGADQLGRCVLSRVIHGARISLSIGLLGVGVSFIMGCLLGGVSGLLGGPVDMAIQRVIEFLQSLPTIPLWMALSAAIPIDWPQIQTYFMITVILSIIGWTGLARVVRGKILQLREEDYVTAAGVGGATRVSVIVRHMLPNFLGYLIVHLTLAVPDMILGETALSFLGLGLQPPAVSWGVALQQATSVRIVALHPWLLIPALVVVLTVLCFNFVGDGLRDAADPYR